MRGYKGMHQDMTCRGMQYEIGESYHTDENIEICKNGFHFCKNLGDVFDYYNLSKSRFFEIEANGETITKGDKTVTSDITILRELKEIEVNRAFYYGNGYDSANGNGYGDGYSGNGYNSGIGYGYDHGIGYGNGHGDGYGYDNGNGYKIHGVLITGGKV